MGGDADFAASGAAKRPGQRLSADVPVSLTEESDPISCGSGIIRDLFAFGVKPARMRSRWVRKQSLGPCRCLLTIGVFGAERRD